MYTPSCFDTETLVPIFSDKPGLKIIIVVYVDYTGIRWWIMIVGAADHRLIAAGLPDI